MENHDKIESNETKKSLTALITNMKATNFIRKGDFTLKSGRKSQYYVDVKCLISYPNIMAELSNLLYIKIIGIIKKENIKIDDVCLCGLPYAGIPFVSYISMRNNIPMILLRKEQKKYGTKKQFEGSLEKTKHLILVDDILTTGLSICESVTLFKELGYQNNISAIVLIDREESDLDKQSFGQLKHLDSVFKLNKFV
jgi:orotate phosphoribosyltransferase